MTLHLVLLLAYSALLIGLGLWIGRRVKSAEDFFVAGRGLGPGLIFATFVAANIGAGSTVGASALGYRDGLSAWWWVGSAGIGSLVLGLTVGPRIRRLARKHDLRTVGDFLEYRYHRSVRAMIAAVLWVGTLFILAGQLIAIGSILNVVAGIPRYAGCLIGGAVIGKTQPDNAREYRIARVFHYDIAHSSTAERAGPAKRASQMLGRGRAGQRLRHGRPKIAESTARGLLAQTCGCLLWVLAV